MQSFLKLGNTNDHHSYAFPHHIATNADGYTSSIYTLHPVYIYSHTFWLLLRDIIFDNVHVDAFFRFELGIGFFFLSSSFTCFSPPSSLTSPSHNRQWYFFYIFYSKSFRRVWLPSERCRYYCRCHRPRFLWRDVACASAVRSIVQN